jgi:hypothetical protein
MKFKKKKKSRKTKFMNSDHGMTNMTHLKFLHILTKISTLNRVVKRTSREVSQTNLTDKGKKSYDILPGVGEIILWAAKDKRGYLIDINGSWYNYFKLFILHKFFKKIKKIF